MSRPTVVVRVNGMFVAIAPDGAMVAAALGAERQPAVCVFSSPEAFARSPFAGKGTLHLIDDAGEFMADARAHGCLVIRDPVQNPDGSLRHTVVESGRTLIIPMGKAGQA